MYQDETLTCRDCGREFVFSASEQAFFAEKGFQNKPSRCPECRAARAKEEVPADKAVDGVISLLEGERMNIEPKALKRHERNAKRNG